MKEVLKYLLGIILIIILCIIISKYSVDAHGIVSSLTTVEARLYGSINQPTDTLPRLGINNVFCIQQGQHIATHDVLNISYYVTIDKKQAKVYQGNKGGALLGTYSSDNIQNFAAILAKNSYNFEYEHSSVQFNGSNADLRVLIKAGWSPTNNFSYGVLTHNDNDPSDNSIHSFDYTRIAEGFGHNPRQYYSAKQMAVYQNFNSFRHDIGLDGKVSSTDGNDLINKAGTDGIMTPSESGNSDQEGNIILGNGTKWTEDAKKEVQNASTENASIDGNKTAGKEYYEYNGTRYIKIGPFKWTYKGEYSNKRVSDQNGGDITSRVLFGRYESNNFMVYSNIGDASKSAQDFYLLVPNNIGVTKVKLWAQVKQTTIGSLTAEIWILTSNNGKQNFISTEATKSVTDTYAEIETDEIELSGNLEIVKQDADISDDKMAGVQIRIQSNDGTYNQTFTTDSEGKVKVEGLTPGSYKITEISNPYYGYTVMTNQNIDIEAGQTATCILTNEKQTGNLQIKKEDTDTGNPLKGVQFRIRYQDTGKYLKINGSNGTYVIPDGNQTDIVNAYYVDSINDATIFTTDENGEILIKNVLTGIYEVTEIGVGEENENYYEVDDNYISWESNYNLNGSGATSLVMVKREKRYNTFDDSKRVIEDGTYEIELSRDSSKVLEVAGDGKENATNIQVYDRNGTDAQKFYFQYIGNGYYAITATNSNKMMDVTGASTANGTQVEIYASNGSSAQKWKIEDLGNGYYSLIPHCSEGSRLDIYGNSTSNGAKVEIYESNGSDAQKFKLNRQDDSGRVVENGIYEIETGVNNNLVVDIAAAGTANETNVQVYRRTYTAAQKFYFKYIGNGYYVITNIGSNKNLDVYGANTNDRTNVQIYEDNGSAAQKWKITQTADGYYNITNLNSDKNLDVDGKDGTIVNETNVQIYTKNTSSNQKFKLKDPTIEDGIYEIQTGHNSSLVLDVANAGTTNGTNLQASNRNSASSSKFYVKKVSDGDDLYYTITDINSNKNVDVTGGIATDGTNVQIYEKNNSNAQKWLIGNIGGEGNYYLYSGVSDMSQKVVYVLDVAVNDNNVQIWGYSQGANRNSNQTFKFNDMSPETDNDATVTYLTIKNRRKYINLSGYVWEDIQSGKQSYTNELYRSDINDDADQLMNNIPVYLKDRNGNIVQQAVTGSAGTGSYLFEKVEIDQLENYYIEFEYNGMVYQNVTFYRDVNADVNEQTKEERGSKAVEATNNVRAHDEMSRDEFNENYAIISEGQSNDSRGNKTYDLDYTSGNYESHIVYGDNLQYGYEGATKPVNGYDQYMLTANTYNAYHNSQDEGYLDSIKSPEEIRQQGITEINNINLGLYEREQPDLALAEDLEKIEISLNGYTHTYNYDQRFKNPASYAGGDDIFNATVKFQEKYMTNSYSRAVYESDVIYNSENPDSLEVYMTYKVAIRNQSTNLTSQVLEIANYFDERYDISRVYQRTENNGTETNITNLGTVQSQNNGLNRIDIEVNQEVSSQNIQYIYIEYKLTNDAINALLNAEANNGVTTLESASEITSYSTYETTTAGTAVSRTPYAGIDLDSAPHSFNSDEIFEDRKPSIEDDTDRAPSLQINVVEGRTIKGTVWEDEALQALLEQNERIGNGTYDDSENVVGNVTVELLEVDENGNVLVDAEGNQTVANIYRRAKDTNGNYIPGNNGYETEAQEASVTTNNSGEYEFRGVIPGRYLIKYIYGDSSVIYDMNGNQIGNVDADSYKSTIYRTRINDEGTRESYNIESDDYYWYGEETGGTGQYRLSDAKDSDDIITERMNENDKEFTYATENSQESSITEIDAYTPQLEIKIEYDIDNITEYLENSNDTQLVSVFDNIDFGIIERPRQDLELSKDISNVQISLANGQTIINGNPQTDTLSGVRYLEDETYGKRVMIEMDSELMQGSTMKVTYAITIDNTGCEVDYNDENYYIYGSANEGATLKFARVVDIYDYMSDDLVLDSTLNSDWELVSTDDIKATLKDNEGNDVLDKDGNLIYSGGLISKEVYDAITDNNLKNILHIAEGSDTYEALRSMDPNTTCTINLQASRYISSSSDDLSFENDVEVIKLTGRQITDTPQGDDPGDTPEGGTGNPEDPPSSTTTTSTPGNYDPVENSPDEPDDDRITLIITRATGENRNYYLYGIIGASALIIIGAGIIIIKRKVLKK